MVSLRAATPGLHTHTYCTEHTQTQGEQRAGGRAGVGIRKTRSSTTTEAAMTAPVGTATISTSPELYGRMPSNLKPRIKLHKKEFISLSETANPHTETS